ncbi:MAG: hypothetical protein ABR574_04890 [Cryomorphaceae bacterium]|nr:hypothetical protein [Flavobacteriales bacterium]
MKNLLVTFFVIASTASIAQEIQLTGSYGYRFGGSVDVYYNGRYGEIKFEDSEAFSLDITYKLRDDFGISAQYWGQNTAMDYFGYASSELDGLGDVLISYILVGPVYEKRIKSVTPFGNLGVGAVIMDPQRAEFSSDSRFAVGLNGGVKIDISHRLAIQLRAGILMPMQMGGAGLFCSGGGGCGVDIGTSTTIMQGDISGGVILKLGDVESAYQPTPTSSPQW